MIGLQIHPCRPDIAETTLNGDCQQPAQCRIQKCTTDFVSLTSHLNSAVDGFDSEFCKALRAYAGCTQRTSKACRGNLVYHSAVLGISDLMSQRNCSKDGPTSSTNPEITIIFKAHRECTDQKVYQAVTDDLPAAFVDGSTSGGDGDPKSLRIVERESGRSVEMHARYMGTTVFVRQLGRYLTLAIRMPEALAMAYEESQDLQLCVTGCPLGERIDDGQGQHGAVDSPEVAKLLLSPSSDVRENDLGQSGKIPKASCLLLGKDAAPES
ncbi:hypothetical protein Celaphus_00003895 [Cervus elaphus hippelaphus]|uniref:RGM domain family member B n=1 Tax=Cervus elaphus hippelaphus TaxID=46360 RepID=A0A212D369_CEREH|nr:hypothetical protein Celaphus_00003895 [Cervus elaphus hippelaphus]